MLWQFNLVSDDRDVRETSKGHIRKALELAGALGEMSRFTLARDFRGISP